MLYIRLVVSARHRYTHATCIYYQLKRSIISTLRCDENQITSMLQQDSIQNLYASVMVKLPRIQYFVSP